ncbi:MAG: putative fiber protein [Prokaryotic dsDNA virus sp.]|nr:MAG: putative fiber protein [Prokaryotic dsDNA virus sp.]
MMGKSVDQNTAGASNNGALLIYDNGNTQWTANDTTEGKQLTQKLFNLQLGEGGATVTTILDEDNMATDSATALSTQQSIKAYVDAQVTLQDLDISDGSTTIAIDLDSETLGLLGGVGISSTASGNNVTFAIDATVTTLSGTQTLTNKTLTSPTLTSPVLNTAISGSAFLDEDDMSSNSATKVASQQSIKAYVDTQLTAEDLDVSDGSNSGSIDLDSEVLGLLGGTGLTSSLSGNNFTFAIDGTVATLTGTQTFTNKTLTSPKINGSTAITTTGTEINVLDGDTSASSVVLVDADQFIVNDNGTMKQLAVTRLDTYFSGTTATLTNKTLTSPVLNGTLSGTAFKDEDNMSSNSATAVASQQSIKAYVDSQVTAQDLDVSDGSNDIAIDLDSETLTLAGGTGIDSTANTNTVTFAIDNTVATLSGSQTLTNKTIDVNSNAVTNIEVDNLKVGVLDTDLSSVAATDTTLASAKAIKTYVDTNITAQDLDISDGSSTIAIDLDSETLSLLGGTGVTSTASGNGVTFAIGQSVGTGDDVEFNQVTGALVGNASTATALATARAIALSGDVVGTANFDGTAGISISTTIQANSIVLGTDTTGSYVESLVAGTGVSLANNSGESATPTIAIGQSVGTSDNVQFGTVTAALSGNASTATALATGRTIALSGDVTASGVSFDGTGNITLSTTIAANSVALGTDTTGNYVAGISGTTNEIEVSGSGSEGSTVTIGLPDNVTISGNLTVNGTTTTTDTNELHVTDPLIKLAKDNTANSLDIGFYGQYRASGSNNQFSGLFRDQNDSGKYKLFELLEAEPTTTVNTSGTGFQIATLVANLEGNVTGNLTGAIQTAAQTNITSLGTLTALQVDNININGNTISSTAGTDLNITPLAGQQIVLDGAIVIDAGVVTGATSITSTAFVGNVTGNVTGTSATVTGAAQTNITSLGTLTALQVDNININGNTISSSAGTDLNITPLSGQQIVLDGTIIIDAGVVTGATSITSTAFVGDITGDVTGNADTSTTLANSRNFSITGDITASAIAFDGSGNVALSASIDDNVVGAAQLNISGNGTAGQAVLSDGDGSFSYGSSGKTTEEIQDIVGAMVSSNTETGITVTYEDGDGTLDFVINPAQTTITSLLATDIKIGEDDQTKIDFGTADEIHFFAGNESQIKLTNGALVPSTDNDIDLGTSSAEFKNAFFDGTVTSDAFSGPLTGDVTGNASTATALETARTIGGTSFDGTGNIAVALSATATALANARTIGGVSFDGTANINLAGVNTTGNQDTTGNAATATILATARTIGGTSFDGSANIAVALASTATTLANARTINGVSFDGSANITTLTAGTGVSVSGTAVSIGQAVATSDSPTFANMTLSGTDSIKVPAGTTGQRNGSPANGMFRYNSTNEEFEGYQNGAWGAIAGGGASAMETNTFTGDGSTTAFTISSNVSSEDDLIIFIDGVYQNKADFVASGTTVTFDTAPVNSRKVVINHIKANIAGSSVTQNAFSGDGSTVAFTLSISPTNENNTQIYIDGVYQHKSTYTVSGTTLTFDTAPVNSTAIDVIMFSQTALNTPASDTVTTSTIADANVTSAKLASNAVTTVKIADDAVTSAKLDTNIAVAGTLASTGVLTANAGVVVDNITIDGQEIDVSSGNLTLDIAGELNIDVDGGAINYKDGGTHFGSVEKDGNNFRFESKISDGDIVFRGSDAGSGINALTLDMSNAGAATFNAGATFGGDITLPSSGQINASGALYLDSDITHFRLNNETELMRIQSSGVGIGTTSPTTPLHVESSTSNQNTTLIKNTAGTGVNYGLEIQAGTNATDHALQVLDSGGTSRLRVTGEGKVGIGNTAPLGKLTISNAAGQNAPTSITAANTYLQLGSDDFGPDGSTGHFMIGFGYTDATNTNSPAYIGFKETSTAGDTKGELIFLTRDVVTDTAPTERLRITDGGDVSIGSDHSGFSGYRVLNLRGGSTGGIYNLENSSGTRTASLLNTGSDLRLQTFVSGGNIQFEPEGTEAMRIHSGGTVSINSTSTKNADMGSTPKLFIENGSTSSTSNLGLYNSSTANIELMEFMHERAGGVDTAFMAIFRENAGNAVGSISINGSATTYNTSSDYRLKTNIRPIENGIDRVNKLKPVKFDWIDNSELVSEGFIAHEVDEIFADAVSGVKDKVDEKGKIVPQSLDYGRITPLLVKAIQEQQEQIETLKAEVKELKDNG